MLSNRGGGVSSPLSAASTAGVKANQITIITYETLYTHTIHITNCTPNWEELIRLTRPIRTLIHAEKETLLAKEQFTVGT